MREISPFTYTPLSTPPILRTSNYRSIPYLAHFALYHSSIINAHQLLSSHIYSSLRRHLVCALPEHASKHFCSRKQHARSFMTGHPLASKEQQHRRSSYATRTRGQAPNAESKPRHCTAHPNAPTSLRTQRAPALTMLHSSRPSG
eukprot:3351561-Pleurochrysis_carterae.AAC.1